MVETFLSERISWRARKPGTRMKADTSLVPKYQINEFEEGQYQQEEIMIQ